MVISRFTLRKMISQFCEILALSLVLFLVPISSIFSKECDELKLARMIKAGISDEVIKKQCGDISEEAIVSDENKNLKNLTI